MTQDEHLNFTSFYSQKTSDLPQALKPANLSRTHTLEFNAQADNVLDIPYLILARLSITLVSKVQLGRSISMARLEDLS